MFNANAHEKLFSDSTLRLGEMHWIILTAAWRMDNERWNAVECEFGHQYEKTELGEEVGMDEIHWWVFEKETDTTELLARSEATYNAVQTLNAAATKLKNERPEDYEHLLSKLQDFAEKHRTEVNELHDYVTWLAKRHPMAPRILFTYRVWGSTRMADRDMRLTSDDVDRHPDMNKIREATEIVLGVRHRGLPVYLRVEGELEYEIYEGMDFEDVREIRVPESQVITRAAREILDNCAIYFTELRDSVRNIILDISKMNEQQNLFESDRFWSDFIAKAAKAKTPESQLWDFKETLIVWQPLKTDEERRKAKVTLAEDVASFANASGEVLIVGVSDKREIVGVGNGKELENRLKAARDIIATHVKYPRETTSFRQVVVPTDKGEKICLVIVVSQAYQPVGVNDGMNRFTYPIRRETGITRVAPEELSSKIHLKADNRDFMSELARFVKESR